MKELFVQYWRHIRNMCSFTYVIAERSCNVIKDHFLNVSILVDMLLTVTELVISNELMQV